MSIGDDTSLGDFGWLCRPFLHVMMLRLRNVRRGFIRSVRIDTFSVFGRVNLLAKIEKC